jgi:hypothetical protein
MPIGPVGEANIIAFPTFNGVDISIFHSGSVKRLPVGAAYDSSFMLFEIPFMTKLLFMLYRIANEPASLFPWLHLQ